MYFAGKVIDLCTFLLISCGMWERTVFNAWMWKKIFILGYFQNFILVEFVLSIIWRVNIYIVKPIEVVLSMWTYLIRWKSVPPLITYFVNSEGYHYETTYLCKVVSILSNAIFYLLECML